MEKKTTRKSTKKDESVKSLLLTENIHRDNALRHEIIEVDGRRFKMVMAVHNGSMKHDTRLSILLPDGTWGYVTDACILNIPLFSYVAATNTYEVNTAWDRVRSAFINYIKIVYA